MQRSSLVPFSKFMSNFKAENPNSIPKVPWTGPWRERERERERIERGLSEGGEGVKRGDKD
eukprot:1342311-Amorphochlora_amoeboformis.AAC.1